MLASKYLDLARYPGQALVARSDEDGWQLFGRSGGSVHWSKTRALGA